MEGSNSKTEADLQEIPHAQSAADTSHDRSTTNSRDKEEDQHSVAGDESTPDVDKTFILDKEDYASSIYEDFKHPKKHDISHTSDDH